MPKRKSGTSKAAWRERLERFAEDPGKDEELLAASTEAYEVAWASYKFDKASQSVQNRRNLHKTEFETLITGIVKKTGVDVTEEDIWGTDNIEHNLRTYLEMSAKMLCPRSFRSETLKFNTIVQRRQSMMFWLNRKCNVAINRGSMWVASQEALHHAFRTYNKPSLNDQKIYLTKQDLLMLIQHNMYTSSSAELAQQHELAWLLAFIFGVRPGTIGTAKGHPDQFLPWGDIEIQRCGTNNFKAAVMFRWLKGYRNEELRPLRFKASEPRFTEDTPPQSSARLHLFSASQRHTMPINITSCISNHSAA